MFREKYADVFKGDERWRALAGPDGDIYAWEPDSTYIRNPPFFESLTHEPAPLTDIANARVLAVLGDSVTTDHISPAGSIKTDSPAGKYLMAHGVKPADFNSYGARRGNHEVMMRGTFANIRLRNQMVPGVEGGFTVHLPDGEQMTIYDASMAYQADGVPLVILAGKEYGSGSSRDWAAKGTMLLGVKAVIAESFERIHRSNLVNMGVLPLQFTTGRTSASLGLTGRETFSDRRDRDRLTPRGDDLGVRPRARTARPRTFAALVRIDTPEELEAFRNGGILPYVLRKLAEVACPCDGVARFGRARRADRVPPRCRSTASEREVARAELRVRSVRYRARRGVPELDVLRDWLARGFHGEMHYIARIGGQALRPAAVLPGARRVIALGTLYNTRSPYSTEIADPGRRADLALRVGRRLPRRDRRSACAQLLDALRARPRGPVRGAALRRHRARAGARVRPAGRARLGRARTRA